MLEVCGKGLMNIGNLSTGIPLKPCFHMGAISSKQSHDISPRPNLALRSTYLPRFLLPLWTGASGAPIYDNAKYVRPGTDIPDMLVRSTHLGAALASSFADTENASAPEHAVVLMRGHGMTVVGPTIQDCVLRAVYTQTNAAVQTTTLLTRAAWRAEMAAVGGQQLEGPIHFLSEEETEAAMGMTRWSAARPWTLWQREVEASGLYVNRG